jgi:hypothetical protein
LKVLDIPSRQIHIFNRLLRLKHSPNLRTLRISISGIAHRIHEFGSLLELLGPDLESLALCLASRHPPPDLMTSIDGLSFASPSACASLTYSPTELVAGRVISLVHNTNLRFITIESGIFTSRLGDQPRSI